MSLEQITKMIEKVSKDKDFASEFSKVYHGGQDFSEVVIFGKNNGFEFTEEECKQIYDAVDSQLEDELSDDDLEKVAGGIATATVLAVTAVAAGLGAVGGAVAGGGASAAVVMAVK